MEIKNYNGLTTETAKKLQKKYGMNKFVKVKKSNPLVKFFNILKEPMFLLLVVTAILYCILGEPKEALIMFIFVVFIASITFVQEWKTEKTLSALKKLSSPQVNVLRDGTKKVINSSELVPGDIIFLAEGERIPADCEILEASNFTVDESILTGETETVTKVEHININDRTDDYWRSDYIYAGTLSIFGKCTAKVKSTGLNTEYGKISKAVSEAKEELTPLQIKTKSLVKNMAIVGFIVCILVIILTYFYNHNLIQSILSGLTLAMAIIPEEFPVVLTIFLSLGAFRLAKKNALMRRISAVETLGSATVLGVDKTGTITKNIMEVKDIYFNNRIISVEDMNSSEFAKLMIMSCEKNPYDPMEKAIVSEAKTVIKDINNIDNVKLVHKIAFNPETKRMANIYADNNNFYVAVKGSPETVIPLCDLNDKEKNEIKEAVDKMAKKGLRIMAFADLESEEFKEELDEYTLEFKGLVGLQDPPKEGVKEAIELCKKAGIRVIMITGDYSKTAMAIGNEIGLKFKDCAITGKEIDNMTDKELCEAVKHCDVFSRVIPEHKMRIVKALKENGEIVAMTGDGVNDAPALKSADIGIAMGKRGTEVAKEAADMVLLDDNFTTIVSSVEDGRRIFDNIRKAMVYILVVHIPIMLIALFSPLCNLPAILLPVHVLFLELIIDPTCSIVFESEEAEANIMEQPPRSPKEPLVNKSMVIKAVLQGLTIFLAAFIPFHYLVDNGYNINMARSFSLMTLIVSNVVLVLVNRSNTEYLFHIFKETENKARLLINCISLIMIFCIIYIPVFQAIFKTSSLNFRFAIASCTLGIVSAAWWEFVKLRIKN